MRVGPRPSAPGDLEDPAVYPPAAVMDRLDAIRDVGEALTLYARIWTEIKISH